MKPVRRRQHLNPNTVLLIKQIVIGVLIFSFIGLSIATIWYGTRIGALTLRDVHVSGGESIAHDDIEKRVRDKLTGLYFGLVPRAFAPLYPEDEIMTSILEVERIKFATIERIGGTALSVNFEEYTPDSLWCSEDDSNCFFIDKEGFSFTKAPDLKGGAFLRLETIGLEPSRVRAFPQAEYDRIKEYHKLLSEKGWHIARVEVDAAKDAYLEVVDGGEFKVSLLDEPKVVIDNLLTVLSSGDFSYITPGNFEYIDLRFGNKVFVNDAEPDAIISTSTPSSTDVVEE